MSVWDSDLVAAEPRWLPEEWILESYFAIDSRSLPARPRRLRNPLGRGRGRQTRCMPLSGNEDRVVWFWDLAVRLDELTVDT